MNKQITKPSRLTLSSPTIARHKHKQSNFRKLKVPKKILWWKSLHLVGYLHFGPPEEKLGAPIPVRFAISFYDVCQQNQVKILFLVTWECQVGALFYLHKNIFSDMCGQVCHYWEKNIGVKEKVFRTDSKMTRLKGFCSLTTSLLPSNIPTLGS